MSFYAYMLASSRPSKLMLMPTWPCQVIHVYVPHLGKQSKVMVMSWIIMTNQAMTWSCESLQCQLCMHVPHLGRQSMLIIPSWHVKSWHGPVKSFTAYAYALSEWTIKTNGHIMSFLRHDMSSRFLVMFNHCCWERQYVTYQSGQSVVMVRTMATTPPYYSYPHCLLQFEFATGCINSDIKANYACIYYACLHVICPCKH